MLGSFHILPKHKTTMSAEGFFITGQRLLPKHLQMTCFFLLLQWIESEQVPMRLLQYQSWKALLCVSLSLSPSRSHSRTYTLRSSCYALDWLAEVCVPPRWINGRSRSLCRARSACQWGPPQLQCFEVRPGWFKEAGRFGPQGHVSAHLIWEGSS